MNQKEIIQAMFNAIIELDQEKVLKIAEQAVENDLDLTQFVQDGMSPAMEAIGDKFQKGEMYLPELQISADIFQAAMAVVEPKLMQTQENYKEKRKVIIGTVKGDLHSIGKDLVATLLKTDGYEVIDLGVDISSLDFMEKAVKSNAQVIALSALLTTTMAVQKEVIDALKDNGVRERFKVIVGGAPVNQKWADDIGADAYGENAVAAGKIIESLFPK
jgi:corrinoid protein of di/trimethylamine methyltransferase